MPRAARLGDGKPFDGQRADVTARKLQGLHDETVGGHEDLAVAETDLEDGRIPQAELAGLREWLVTQSADAADRRAVVQSTVAGAVRLGVTVMSVGTSRRLPAPSIRRTFERAAAS